MTTTRVSFLGRVPREKDNGKYTTARSRFPDGFEIESPFFGLALLERLEPNRLVLLGTSGSMWDVLIEHLVKGRAHEELRLALLEAAEGHRADTDLMERVQPVVAQAIGRPCTIKPIDYGRNEGEQMVILEGIEAAAPKGAVTLDLTHGFRPLTALGVLSAFFLERIARLDVDGLYCGALVMTEARITPVIHLDGLHAVQQRWIDALEPFDQNGDYAVFAPLPEAGGLPPGKARCLARAAYFEGTLNLAGAGAQIQTFLGSLDASLPGASGLFQDALRRRLAWARNGTLFDHQARLARLPGQRRHPARRGIRPPGGGDSSMRHPGARSAGRLRRPPTRIQGTGRRPGAGHRRPPRVLDAEEPAQPPGPRQPGHQRLLPPHHRRPRAPAARAGAGDDAELDQ